MTSSAVVGSSAMRSSASQASAIAIITRWRHAAGELVRERVEAAPRIRDAHHLEQLERPSRASLRVQLPMELEHLAELHPDVVDRVEAAGRLLEDHADPLAAHRAHLALGSSQQVDAVEDDLTGRRSGRAAR